MNTKKLVLTALMLAMFSGSAAFAGPKGNGNGNGNSGGGNSQSDRSSRDNGRGAQDNGRNTNGAIASELKWRNAGHASAQAFANASSNSAVGVLAKLKAASAAADAIYDEILSAIAAIDLQLIEMEAAEGFNAAAPPVEYTDLQAQRAALEADLVLPETVAETGIAEAEAEVGIEELSDLAIVALWDLLETK